MPWGGGQGAGGLKPAGDGALWISVLRLPGPDSARRRIAPGRAPGPERMLKEVRCVGTGRGDVPAPRAAADGGNAPAGFLAVRLRGRWQRLWCAVRQGALRMFPEPGGTQRPVCALRLEGCEVSPGAAAGSPQHLRIRIAQRGRELALLQVSNRHRTPTSITGGGPAEPGPSAPRQTRSDEEREAWLKTLRARGGEEPAGDSPCTETPRVGDASGCPAAG